MHIIYTIIRLVHVHAPFAQVDVNARGTYNLKNVKIVANHSVLAFIHFVGHCPVVRFIHSFIHSFISVRPSYNPRRFAQVHNAISCHRRLKYRVFVKKTFFRTCSNIVPLEVLQYHDNHSLVITQRLC